LNISRRPEHAVPAATAPDEKDGRIVPTQSHFNREQGASSWCSNADLVNKRRANGNGILECKRDANLRRCRLRQTFVAYFERLPFDCRGRLQLVTDTHRSVLKRTARAGDQLQFDGIVDASVTAHIVDRCDLAQGQRCTSGRGPRHRTNTRSAQDCFEHYALQSLSMVSVTVSNRRRERSRRHA
jgi:hypothetical protein